MLGFLVMKIKHLWTWGLGKVTLENMPELARNGVYPVSKNAQELLWLGRRGNLGEGVWDGLCCCAQTARAEIMPQVNCTEV